MTEIGYVGFRELVLDLFDIISSFLRRDKIKLRHPSDNVAAGLTG